MTALSEATVKEIHELAEAEGKRDLGPLFENDQEL
jgi:hypothetical protein